MSIPGMRRAAIGLTALAVTAFGAVTTTPDQADAGPKPVAVSCSPSTTSTATSSRRPASGGTPTDGHASTPAAPRTSPPTLEALRGRRTRRTRSPSPPAT